MRKRVIDLSAACVCLAIVGIICLYPDQIRNTELFKWAAAAGAVLYLLLAVKDGQKQREMTSASEETAATDSGLITELILLSEEDTELMTWDLYGKTSAVIGRDVKENQVDIDLGSSSYASMVDVEHAVLNYSAGNWYVEDLGSSNGVRLKKSGDGKIYSLSADTPCKLDRGDCLHIGQNRLLLR